MSSESFHHHAFRPTEVVLSFCTVASLSAAQDAQEEKTVVPATPMPAINEINIDQFAGAYLAIEKIYAETANQLDTMQTGGESVILEAEERVIRAIERSGLRPDEFNRIAKRTAMDGKLRVQIARKIAARRQMDGASNAGPCTQD